MLKSKTLNELKDLCAVFELEYSKNARKQDIIEVIEEAGITWEMYEESSKSLFDYTPEPKVEHKDAEEKELKVLTINEPVQEKILLKMFSDRGSYLAMNNIIFTIDEPFALVPENIGKQIIVRSKNDIREATAEEAAQFYGVK